MEKWKDIERDNSCAGTPPAGVLTFQDGQQKEIMACKRHQSNAYSGHLGWHTNKAHGCGLRICSGGGKHNGALDTSQYTSLLPLPLLVCQSVFSLANYHQNHAILPRCLELPYMCLPSILMSLCIFMFRHCPVIQHMPFQDHLVTQVGYLASAFTAAR